MTDKPPNQGTPTRSLRLFGRFCDVVVELLFTDPNNLEITGYIGRDARMGRNILLDLAKHQALAGNCWGQRKW
jgi:hypothetical protein